jgi:outer membrane protein assembly factor BamD
MIYLRNELAQHEISVAEYYLSREAWMGAINRAKIVIERYEKSIWRKRALEIMIIGYNKLGLTDLAADTQRILDLNRDTASNLVNFDKDLEQPPQSSWYKFW